MAVVATLVGCGSGSSIKSDANVFDPTNASDEELMIFAAKDGDVGRLKELMDEYSDLPEWRALNGMTLMHHAAMFSRNEVIQFLVDNGADVNALDDEETTPLASAIDRGADESTVTLLESLGGQE